MSKKAYLLLENGTLFEGESFGAAKTSVGELVFTTAMCGYLETLNDPGFFGQMVCQTFPLIGNYGVIPADISGKMPLLTGYIVREWCQEPSNFRSEGSLDAFLLSNDIPAISGVDTRELTRILREQGSMNALLTTDASLIGDVSALKSYKVSGAVEATGGCEVTHKGAGRRVVLWNFGAVLNVADELVKRGCEVVTVPYSATASEIAALSPAGIVLSDGSGNPADYTAIAAEIAKLCGNIPMLGLGLGHQLLALANGGGTEKMRHGHRGANQPVTEILSGRTYTTNQNHGYAVDPNLLPNGAVVSFRNVSDGSVEGFEYSKLNAFSVQFRPETVPSPQSTGFVFDRFIEGTEVR